MSRILTVRYEKQSLIADWLLGYFFLYFAKIIHHPSYSEPRLKRRYVSFSSILLFALNWTVPLSSEPKFWRDGIHEHTRHSSICRGWAFGVLHPNNGLLCSAVDDLENSLGPTPPKIVHRNYFNTISTRNSPPPVRSHVIIPPPRDSGEDRSIATGLEAPSSSIIFFPSVSLFTDFPDHLEQ